MRATVFIRFRDDVPDAQGHVVYERLLDFGFHEVKEVRMGKLIQLELDAVDRDHASARIKQMCEKLLANAFIEEFEIHSVA